MNKISNLISDSLQKIDSERKLARDNEQKKVQIELDRKKKMRDDVRVAHQNFLKYTDSPDVYILIEQKTHAGIHGLANNGTRIFFTWDEVEEGLKKTDNQYIMKMELSDADRTELLRYAEQANWLMQFMPIILCATSGTPKTPEETFKLLGQLGCIVDQFQAKFQSSPINFIALVNRIKTNMQYNINHS